MIGTATYLLLWPEDGILRKDDVRRVFDGSIFQKKADDYSRKQAKQRALKSSKKSGNYVSGLKKAS